MSPNLTWTLSSGGTYDAETKRMVVDSWCRQPGAFYLLVAVDSQATMMTTEQKARTKNDELLKTDGWFIADLGEEFSPGGMG